MSREESDDETSNVGSGTESEEEEDDQKREEELSRSDESSSGSESGSESDATESRFIMTRNEVGDKRDRDEPPELHPAMKKAKTLGGKPAPVSSKPSKNSAPPKASVKKQAEPKKPGDPPKKKESEKETPKKTAWTSDQEHALVQHIFEEMKLGSKPPKRGSRGENYHYWGDVHEACQGKFITEWSKDQLYDKYRRMKIRYDGMVEKERAEGVSALKFKNPEDEKLYNLWKEMYEMQEQEEQAEARKSGPEKSNSNPDDEAGRKEPASSSRKANAPKRQNGSEEKNPGFAAAVDELQRKYNAELGEMKGKFEAMMNQLQVRSSSLAFPDGGSSSGGVNGLNEWLMLSMAARSSPLFNAEMMMPHMFGIGASGGLFSGGISDPAAMKLKEHWLKQQEEELRVMEQRLQLLQSLCQHQQDVLRKQQQL